MPSRVALLLSVAAIAALVACKTATDAGSSRQAPARELVKVNEQGTPREVVFTGTCDASGAIALSSRSVLVANDEDNVLRVYDVERGGAPSSELDLSSLLELPQDPKRASAPELDIEAAARIGERAYFVTSHARNSKGKLKSERLRFFATNAPADGALQLVGRPYTGLLNDLLNEPRLARFDLRSASQLAPKDRGGLNLEGMTARAQGGVWLGFRNPIPEGRALLVPLLNPEQLIDGQPARFGDPVTLDLGGLGVRALAPWRGGYLIAAGAFDSAAAATLFVWDGGESATRLSRPGVERYQPEALFTREDLGDVLVLSDDGSHPVEGGECKRLKSAAQKRFRGAWFKAL